MGLVEAVEQRALDPPARDVLHTGFDLAANRLAQTVDALMAELLGEFFIDLAGDGFLDLLHRNLEHGFLARQIGIAVIPGEGHRDVLAVAGLGADQLVLEAGNEGSRSERQMEVLGLAALELLAVDLAREIDHQHVAILGGALLLDRLQLAILLGHAVESLLDGLVIGHRLKPLERVFGEIGRLDLRQNLDLEREGQILAGLVFVDLDLGLGRRADALLFQGALRAFVQRALDYLAADGIAESRLDDRRRHLAGTEAGNVDLSGELLQARVHALAQFGGWKDNPEFAPKAFGVGFCHLHRRLPLHLRLSESRRGCAALRSRLLEPG